MSPDAFADRTADSGPTLPEIARAGAKAGIASAFAYLTTRARLFTGAPQAQLVLGGHYTLLDKLGEGAAGVVFLAADTRLMRKVAIKVLRTPGDPQARARLLREAQHLAQLNHPHVLQVYEVGEHGSEIYLVMEYVEGAPLDVWIARSKPTFRALLGVLIDVGRGLAAAHVGGVIHRDVKPANILIGKDGRSRIGDFGLAWFERSFETGEGEATWPEAERMRPSALSQSGAGTPAYMSPEQFRRLDLDARTDLFSFCVVVWEAVYGARPHQGATIEALSAAICDGRIAAVGTPQFGVPARLEAILRRGLAPDRSDRHADMPALLTALERLRQQRSFLRFALAAAFGAGVVLAGSQVAAGTCQDTGAGLDALWSPAVAVELAQSLPVTDRGAADALVDYLDGFVADVRRSRTSLCERHDDASLSEAGHARGQACLDEREDALRSALSLLRSPGVGALAITPEDLASALGSVARCRDPRYLAAAVEPPTPEQSAALAAVRALRHDGELALLRGEFHAAAGTFAAAVDRARTIGHDPATAQSLYDLGRTHLRLRRGDEAIAALREAQILADGARDSFTAADASLLLFSAAVASHDLAAAEWHERETLARLRQSGRDHGGLLGELELARVDRLLRLDRVDEAAPTLAAAREHLLGDPPGPGLWRYNLPRMEARVAAARGDSDLAVARAGEAWAALAAFVGSDKHPLYAEELGRHLLDAGDLEAAERELSRAREAYAAALGLDSIHVVSVDIALARLHDMQGRSDDVARIAARADAILRLYPDEPMTLDERVAVAGYLGRELVGAGRYAEALATFERGVTALAAADLPIQAANFALLAASGADLRIHVPGLRDVSRARERIEAALDRWPAARRLRDPGLAAFVLRVAADTALAADDRVTARQYAEEALELLARAPDPAIQARLEFVLARALGHDNPSTRGLATSAREYFESVGRTTDAGEIQAWLAQGT